MSFNSPLITIYHISQECKPLHIEKLVDFYEIGIWDEGNFYETVYLYPIQHF